MSILISDKLFVYFMRSTRLTTKQVGTLLAVSLPTVRRWRNNVDLPVQGARHNILSRLDRCPTEKFYSNYGGK